MCGIIGFLPFQASSHDRLKQTVQKMCAAISHRGPDDAGIYFDERNGLALGFQRLAILDLSENGAQPMESASGRYMIVFNGEIYNFQELRQELEPKGYKFKGGSDTEVLLAAIEEWGFKETLPKLNGMFALALYDRQAGTIAFARDRTGKKPLYLGWGAAGFYVASELKAVHAVEAGKLTLNKNAAALYIQWRYIPDPYAIYQNFWKLKPGHMLELPLAQLKQPDDLVPKMAAFWSLSETLRQARPYTGSAIEARGHLENLLNQSVARRMIADVPLGAFLSGGIDSSLIAALIASQQKPRTFTIGFEDPAFNEADIARDIATHLGSDHTEITVTACDALDTLELVGDSLDEPFGDPSIIPTYQVCKLARQHMTVALSGDGGDELFGGYGWYRRAERLRKVPLKHIIAAFLVATPQQRKIASILKSSTSEEIYAALHSYAQTTSEPLLNYVPEPLSLPYQELPAQPDLSCALMASDMVMFMTGDVLTKVDRASMANSLEVRNPFLDYNIIGFVASLPPEMRRNKNMLKDLLRAYLPDHLIDRPKQGFSIPHSAWLRGPLREWADELLSLPRLEKTDLFNTDYVHKIWVQHKEGRLDYGHLLWTIAMFQNWHRRWM